jgi:DNA-binding GntR family transcriptional regulator
MFGRIEGLLTELAAERRNARELRQLTDLHRQIIAVTQPTETAHPDYRELNQQFHQMIHDMARSPLIDERQHSLFSMSDFFISQSAGFGAMQANGLREHDEIVEAIARQSVAGARYAAEAHIASVSATVVSGLALAAADEDQGSAARPRRARATSLAG